MPTFSVVIDHSFPAQHRVRRRLEETLVD